MLSKFALVAGLALLSEGAIELELTKMARMSNNGYYSVKTLQNGDLDLTEGAFTVQESYATEITIDNKVYKVLCDTGSSDLLIVGDSCVTYGLDTCHPTATTVGKCVNNAGYTGTFDATYSGYSTSICYGTPGVFTFAAFDIYITDVTMGCFTAQNQYIGYITSQTENMWGSGDGAADGILGLSYNSNSQIWNVTDHAGETFMSTMSRENGLPNALAMCFDPSGTGGKMVIGGGKLANMQYTSVIKETWYTVGINSISVGDTMMPDVTDVSTIVDSGTTEFVVPPNVFNSTADVLCSYLNCTQDVFLYDGEECQQDVVPGTIYATPDMIAQLPDLTVSLPGGVTLVVPPQSYFMYQGGVSYGEYLPYNYGIANGYEEMIILGDVVLLGNWVYFDTENDQVGFKTIDHCNQQY